MDKKLIELMNQDLDGEISARDKQKLQAYLEKDSAARDHYAELVQVSNILGKVKPVDPGVNLKKRIMNTIPANKYAPKASAPHRAGVELSLRFRYLLSFAAGAAAALFIMLFLSDSLLNHPVDTNALSGTAVTTPASRFEITDGFTLDETGVRGTVVSFINGNLVLVESNLSGPAPLDTRYGFGNKLAFSGLKGSEDIQAKVELEADQITLRGLQNHAYLLVFTVTDSEDTKIRVNIQSTTVMLEETLSIHR